MRNTRGTLPFTRVDSIDRFEQRYGGSIAPCCIADGRHITIKGSVPFRQLIRYAIVPRAGWNLIVQRVTIMLSFFQISLSTRDVRFFLLPFKFDYRLRKKVARFENRFHWRPRAKVRDVLNKYQHVRANATRTPCPSLQPADTIYSRADCKA